MTCQCNRVRSPALSNGCSSPFSVNQSLPTNNYPVKIPQLKPFAEFKRPKAAMRTTTDDIDVVIADGGEDPLLAQRGREPRMSNTKSHSLRFPSLFPNDFQIPPCTVVFNPTRMSDGEVLNPSASNGGFSDPLSSFPSMNSSTTLTRPIAPTPGTLSQITTIPHRGWQQGTTAR